ncbi:MAG TPA: helix-turn-helix transcriptional regulator [Pseudolabrys sp.]|nr:helix-turn-helix transcriptional regulator [Pseudolabrys sp.]
MNEDEELSRLVGDIYDAALAPACWPEVLPKVAQFVDGQAAGLLSKDSVSKVGAAYYHCGVAPQYIQVYAETYYKFDPMTALAFFDVGQIASIVDLVPYDEFRQGRFYREWVEPQGWIDAANVVLEKSATTFAYLSVMRDRKAGFVDEAMRRRMMLIAPHVRRAVLIGRAIDLKSAETATFADTLDGLGAGLFLIDSGGRIVHANAAGHALLNAGNVLKGTSGRLSAADPEADRTLHEIFAAAGKGDAALGAEGIAVPLTASDSEPYVVHTLPLTSGARRRAGIAYAATTALFVQKASLHTPSPPEAIARTYKLTPSELRVLLAIVEVGGVPEVAEALGVSAETIRTHLGRLYEKTGARRQAELVKLLAGFVSPLA